MLTLAFLLSMLTAPFIQGAETITVHFGSDGPEGIRGVACHSDFKAVEGHAQALCEGLPDRSIMLYPEHIPDRRTLLDTLAHEAAHFRLGVNHGGLTAWERFHEAEAYAIGRAYAYRACLFPRICE